MGRGDTYKDKWKVFISWLTHTQSENVYAISREQWKLKYVKTDLKTYSKIVHFWKSANQQIYQQAYKWVKSEIYKTEYVLHTVV